MRHCLLILCWAYALVAAGCRHTQNADMPLPAMPKGEKECFFIANTSRVDFDDLIVISESSPRMEGFFGAVYPMSQFEQRRPVDKLQVFEAEWLLVFDRPVGGPDAAFTNAEEVMRAFDEGRIKVGFTAMAEGKNLVELSDKGTRGEGGRRTNHWIPASDGNNFYLDRADEADGGFNPVLIERSSESGDYHSLAELEADMLQGGFDSQAVCIDIHKTSNGRTKVKRAHIGGFKDLREEMFAGKQHRPLRELLKVVVEKYYNPKYEGSRVPLRGVNWGMHGSRAGHVGELDRMICAYPCGQILDLFHDLLHCRTLQAPVWTKRVMVKRMIRRCEYLGRDEKPVLSLRRLPGIGEHIGLEAAREIAKDQGLDPAIIPADECGAKAWKFDGVSVLCEPLARLITGSCNVTEIALRHDLKYAYAGNKGKVSRCRADCEFRRELKEDGAHLPGRWAAYLAVRLGGTGLLPLPWSWGYALK